MYTNTFDNFNTWTQEHRPFQNDAIKSMEDINRGQIIIPTGTGKTRIQIHIHVKDMIQKTLENKTGVYVIAAHRLLLCQQLLDDFVKVCVNAGLQFDLLFIGSLNYNIDDKFKHYAATGWQGKHTHCDSTTQGKIISETYERAKKDNRHLIIAATYHSFTKLKQIPFIDICTYDEAHTTTADNFTANILEACDFKKTHEDLILDDINDHIQQINNRIKRNYFFTATRKANKENDNLAMNNKALYGEILYSLTPRQAIEMGEIVEPILHFIETSIYDSSYSNTKMLIKGIIESFISHNKKIKTSSCDYRKIASKVLICSNGTKESFEIHNDKDFRNFCNLMGIQVFLLNSKEGYYHNFKEVRRNELLEKMRGLKDNQPAIFIHIRILTEGIDLPSITGIMPLRNLNPIHLFQTIGRGVRLLKEDREKIYSGEIKYHEKEKLIKPFCHIILPIYYEHLSNHREMVNLIRNICNYYEIPYENYIKEDICISYKEEELKPITERDKIVRKQKETVLQHRWENVIQLLKYEEIAREMNKKDFLEELFGEKEKKSND